jgi:hypothetical protein
MWQIVEIDPQQPSCAPPQDRRQARRDVDVRDFHDQGVVAPEFGPAPRASGHRAAHYLTGNNGRGRSAGSADPRRGPLFARTETDRNDEEIEYEFPLTTGRLSTNFP